MVRVGLSRSRSNTIRQQKQVVKCMLSVLVGLVLCVLCVWFTYLFRVLQHNHTNRRPLRVFRASTKEQQQQQQQCSFRKYPNHRYYHLNDKSPDFLQGDYVYGEWPIVLSTSAPPVKLCVNQSSWNTKPIPFADGTNPSIVSMQRLQREAPLTAQTILAQYPQTAFVATVCMTHSQCQWKDASSFDDPTQPDTVRTLLQLLDKNFYKLTEATIFVTLDAPWGRRFRQPSKRPFNVHTPSLDDARLFVYHNQLWVSFREGRGFGFETQVLHPVHIVFDNNNNNMTVQLLASEATQFCCGRNMALLSPPATTNNNNNNKQQQQQSLFSLTWVDPVTIISVDTTPNLQRQNPVPHPKKLPKGFRKSHVHGTNGFMVPYKKNNNNNNLYLGIGHFHRPNDRRRNPYARFGHHYTHVWYVLDAHRQTLTHLSAEFVLASTDKNDDAEMIQFLSGLELLDDGTVVVAYGINDCEAGVVTLPLSVVEQVLRPVAGQQVVDSMSRLNE